MRNPHGWLTAGVLGLALTAGTPGHTNTTSVVSELHPGGPEAAAF